MGTIAAFADEKAKPLTEKLSRLLTAAAMCVLGAACSQIPWNSDPDSARNGETSPTPAVSAPVAQPASTAGVARAPVTAPAAVAVAAPAAAPPQAPAAVPAAASPKSAVVPVTP